MTSDVGALTGYTIGITGHRRWDEQAEMLTRRGAEVVHGPVMHTNLLHDADATLEATRAALRSTPDLVVLTTGIGTRSWLAAAESAGLDGELQLAGATATVLARGPKARSAAIAAGLDVAWQAPGETGAEVVDHLRSLGGPRTGGWSCSATAASPCSPTTSAGSAPRSSTCPCTAGRCPTTTPRRGGSSRRPAPAVWRP